MNKNNYKINSCVSENKEHFAKIMNKRMLILLHEWRILVVSQHT